MKKVRSCPVLEVAMMGKLPYLAIRDGIFAHPTLAEMLKDLSISWTGQGVRGADSNEKPTTLFRFTTTWWCIPGFARRWCSTPTNL